MNKKQFIQLMGASAFLILGSVAGIVINGKHAIVPSKAEVPGENSVVDVVGNIGGMCFSENVVSFSKNGYTFYFYLENGTLESNYISLSSGGFIRNITAINNLSSINLQCDQNVIFRKGTGTATVLSKADENLNVSSGTLSVAGATHFMIMANADTKITELQLNFECTHSGLDTDSSTAWDFSWDLKGEGTESNPYLIENLNQWKSVSYESITNQNYFTGTYFKLMNSFSIPSGDFAFDHFDGFFDGNNKTISLSNWSYSGSSRGLFWFVQGNGEVKNLTVDGQITFTRDGDVNGGAIVGINRGVVQNCTNNATVIANTGNIVGGVTGKLENNTSFVIDCTNNGAVTGLNQVGGISGRVPYQAKEYDNGPHISGCNNTGNITGLKTAEARVGGIAGYVAAYLTVENCSNSGTITGFSYLGGIVGRLNGRIVDSSNTGFIFSNRTSTGGIDAAGIAGYAAGYDGGLSLIKNCSNTGDVETTGTVAHNDYGGIVGFTDGASVTVENCINEGDIGNTVAISVGGIVGTWNSTTASVFIKNCINRGDITTYRKGGGILGSTSPSSGTANFGAMISHCENYGAIKSEFAASSDGALASAQPDIGGIVGFINTQASEAMTGTVKKVYSIGENYLIDMNAGELVYTSVDFDLTDVGNASVYDCVNYGDIIGTGCGGGIAGGIATMGSFSRATFKYCYSFDCHLYKLDMVSIHEGTTGWGDPYSSGKQKNCHIFGCSGGNPSGFGCDNIGYSYPNRVS